MICCICGHYTHPDREMEREQQSADCRCDCHSDPFRDPLDETDRDGGALEDANEDAMDHWADRYDELNGAPENEEDR